MQEVAADVANAGMNLLDAGLCLLPVVAELGLSAHGLQRAAQRLFVPPKAVERRVKRPIRERGKAGYAHIDADGARGLRHFPLSLDAYEPLAARLAHGDVLHRAEHVAAVTGANPRNERRYPMITLPTGTRIWNQLVASQICVVASTAWLRRCRTR